jgi:peptidoglycan hydrolase-like protein with peptidoglycan-binding domain
MPLDPSGGRPGLRYIPDPLGRLGFGRTVAEHDQRDPFGRVMARPGPEPELMDLGELYHIRAPIGMAGLNDRRDVARVERLLGRAGVLDLDETDGVTGYAGLRLDEAIRGFQKRHGLKVDGQINPGGETITALTAVLAAENPEQSPGIGKTEKPDETLIPERPGETRDQMETLPTVPGTHDNGEFDIPWWQIPKPRDRHT